MSSVKEEKQIEQLELDEILKVKLDDGYDIGRFIKIVKYKSKDVNSLNESDNNNLYFCKPIHSESELNEIIIRTKIYNKLSENIFDLSFEINPVSEEADSILAMTLKPHEIILSKSMLDRRQRC